MRPPRFDLRIAVGRNLTLTSLSLPLTRQDHDKTPVAVGGHLRALDMWIGRNAIHGSTFWSSRSRRKPGLTHTASRSQARITLNDLSRATSLAARVVAPLSAAGTTIESVERQSDAGGYYARHRYLDRAEFQGHASGSRSPKIGADDFR